MNYELLPKLSFRLKREIKRFNYITNQIDLLKLSSEDMESLRQNSFDVILNMVKLSYPNLDFKEEYPDISYEEIFPVLASAKKSTGFFSYIFYFEPDLYNIMVVRGAKSFNKEVKDLVVDGFKRSLEARLWLESRKVKRRLGKINIEATPMTVFFMDGMRKPTETYEFTAVSGKLLCSVKLRTVDVKKDKKLQGYLKNIQKDLGISKK